jgi:hypothetical protein
LSGTEPLDLATLDRLAYTGSRRFLERLLIASDAVPPRDSRLAWLEAWTERLLSATRLEELLPSAVAGLVTGSLEDLYMAVVGVYLEAVA